MDLSGPLTIVLGYSVTHWIPLGSGEQLKPVISKINNISFLLPGWTQSIALFSMESLKDPGFLSARECENSGIWR